MVQYVYYDSFGVMGVPALQRRKRDQGFFRLAAIHPQHTVLYTELPGMRELEVRDHRQRRALSALSDEELSDFVRRLGYAAPSLDRGRLSEELQELAGLERQYRKNGHPQ